MTTMNREKLKQEVIRQVADACARVDGEFMAFPNHYSYGEAAYKIIEKLLPDLWREMQDRYSNTDNSTSNIIKKLNQKNPGEYKPYDSLKGRHIKLDIKK